MIFSETVEKMLGNGQERDSFVLLELRFLLSQRTNVLKFFSEHQIYSNKKIVSFPQDIIC
jgi:hypothetical protein